MLMDLCQGADARGRPAGAAGQCVWRARAATRGGGSTLGGALAFATVCMLVIVATQQERQQGPQAGRQLALECTRPRCAAGPKKAATETCAAPASAPPGAAATPPGPRRDRASTSSALPLLHTPQHQVPRALFLAAADSSSLHPLLAGPWQHGSRGSLVGRAGSDAAATPGGRGERAGAAAGRACC